MDTRDGRVMRARMLLEVGRWPDAFHELSRVLRECPDDVEAGCLLARCYDLAGDPPGTVAATGRVLAVAPGHEWALRQRAMALVAMRRRREALLCARAAVAAAPHEWRTHATLTEVLLHQPGVRALVFARDAADTVLRLAPDEADAHVVDAQVCLRAGELTLARRACVRALELDPQNQAALHDLAVVDLRRERLGRAGRGFSAALALAPGDRTTGTAHGQGARAVLWRLYDVLAAATVGHLVVFALVAGTLGPWRRPLALGAAVLLLAAFALLFRWVWRAQPLAVRLKVRADRRQPAVLLWAAAVVAAAVASVLSGYRPAEDSVAGNLAILGVMITVVTLAVRLYGLVTGWVSTVVVRLLYRTALLLHGGRRRTGRRGDAAGAGAGARG
ncbi:hypothetical protein OG989_14235 [Micromonospora sp. NBC_01740]|uniref:tetratricopeptide repeat protein n=1 Tax=Micromonospora sp. NBC_01740 TaxID=2975986 RepID=UPI002E162154|nr:hypothetical protein OG989_14235 [Micromonospora sp. NBC_01740]